VRVVNDRIKERKEKLKNRVKIYFSTNCFVFVGTGGMNCLKKNDEGEV